MKQFHSISRFFFSWFWHFFIIFCIVLLSFIDVIIVVILNIFFSSLSVDSYNLIPVIFLNIFIMPYFRVDSWRINNGRHLNYWLIIYCHYFFKFLFKNIMFVVTFDHMSKVGYRRLDVWWNYFDRPEMIGLRHFEGLWFLFIAIFFFYGLQFTHLFFTLHLLQLPCLFRVNKSHLSSDSEECQRTMDNQFI